MSQIRFISLLALLPGLFFLGNGCSSNSHANGSSVEAINVRVEAVSPVTNSERLRYSGTVKEVETLPAAFAVSGIVKDVYVQEGQEVRRGQKLATLDDATFRSSYAIANATYQRALDAVERLKPMHDNGTLPDIKMVEAQTGLEQARATLDLAEKNLKDCVLIAGKSGVVGKRSVDAGIGAAPGMAAITLVQIDRIYAVIAVHENEISGMEIGMPASISIPALGEREWEGEVVELGVVADPLSHTYRAKVVVDNEDHAIRPGMICSVVVVKPGDRETMIVPSEAVLVDGMGQNYVYTVDARTNRAFRKPVHSLGYLLDGIEIADGLEPGDLVVMAGQHRLYDDAQVRIVEASKAVTGVQQ